MPNPSSVAKKAGDALAAFAPYSNGMHVDEESIWHRDGYWRVPVRRGPEATQTYEFYIILADAEQALEDAGLDVMLVPSGSDLPTTDRAEPHRNGASPMKGGGDGKNDEWTNQDVVKAIRLRLAEHPLDNIPIEVLERRLKRSEGWWEVPVRPETNPQRLYLLYEALSQTETDLKEFEGLNVLLVPVPAEDRTLN